MTHTYLLSQKQQTQLSLLGKRYPRSGKNNNDTQHRNEKQNKYARNCSISEIKQLAMQRQSTTTEKSLIWFFMGSARSRAHTTTLTQPLVPAKPAKHFKFYNIHKKEEEEAVEEQMHTESISGRVREAKSLYWRQTEKHHETFFSSLVGSLPKYLRRWRRTAARKSTRRFFIVQ